MASLIGQVTPPGGWTDDTGSGDSVEYILGTGMQIAVAGDVTGIWFYVPSVDIPTNTQFAIGLATWPSNGDAGTITVVRNEAETKPVSGDKGTWKFYAFTTPYTVAAGDRVQALVRTDRYALVSFFFTSADVVNGDITGWQDHANFPNGAFKDSALGTNIGGFPDQSFDQSFYGIDLEFSPAGGATVNGSADLAAVATLTADGTRTVNASADLVATAALAVDGTRGVPGIADLVATATLTVDGSVSGETGADLVATAALAVDGQRTAIASAALAAGSALGAAGFVVALSGASLSASSALSVSGGVTKLGTVALDAVSTLNATGTIAGQTGADLHASSILASTGVVSEVAAAALVAAASLTPAGLVDARASAALVATGALGASLSPIENGSAALLAHAVLGTVGYVHTPLAIGRSSTTVRRLGTATVTVRRGIT